MKELMDFPLPEPAYGSTPTERDRGDVEDRDGEGKLQTLTCTGGHKEAIRAVLLPKADEYRRLMKQFARGGNVTEAAVLLDQFENEQLHLRAELYNSMVNTCAKAGNVEQVEHYMDVYLRFVEMNGLTASIVTFNSVLNACAVKGDVVSMEVWWHRLINWGLEPDEVTYGTLCKALAHHGFPDKVECIMKAIASSGGVVNEFFYASLIMACGAAKPPDPQRAERAFKEMQSIGLKAQRVKKLLARIVGEQRVAELIEDANKGRASSSTNALQLHQ